MSIGPQLGRAIQQQDAWLKEHRPKLLGTDKTSGVSCCGGGNDTMDRDPLESSEATTDAESESEKQQVKIPIENEQSEEKEMPSFGPLGSGVIPEKVVKPKKHSYKVPWENTLGANGAGALLKWKVTGSPPKFPKPAEAAAKCPSVPVDHNQLIAHKDSTDTVQATWMGHASFLVQVGGINVLTDPVWSDRCAPTQFAGPKRYVAPPMELTEFPVPIHVVSISHNHYDHLDTTTVRKLRELHHPHWVVPEGMKGDWFDSTFKNHPEDLAKVHELDWWDCVTIDVLFSGKEGATKVDVCDAPPEESPAEEAEKAKSPLTGTIVPIHITAVPVQHWSMRTGPWDRNAQLWCGFVYEVPVESISLAVTDAATAGGSKSEENNIKVAVDDPPSLCRRYFHCGDTGYAPCFKTIGRVFNHDFDMALIPIGAYHPRWFLSPQHVDPMEAVKIHNDLGKPKLSLGMHWGTWILTDEPIDEPKQLLAEEAEKGGLGKDDFVALKHGETIRTRKL